MKKLYWVAWGLIYSSIALYIVGLLSGWFSKAYNLFGVLQLFRYDFNLQSFGTLFLFVAGIVLHIICYRFRSKDATDQESNQA